VDEDPYNKAYFEGRGSNYWWTVGSYGNFVNFPHWNEILKIIRLYKKSGRLLDIGCAYGLLVNTASEHFEGYGIDVSKFALAKSREFCKSDVSMSSAEKLPFRDESFDVVTLMDTLEHVPLMSRCLQDVTRVLRGNGILMLQLPNPLLWTRVCGRFGLADKTHENDLLMDEWKTILDHHGLRVKKSFGLISYSYRTAKFFIKSTKMISFFPEWWIIAEKRSC
jgi:2-polyprenyl-3-methyl-5-hydroxy-6-metoxy-1,4-benzoquinol methylase